MDFYIKIGVKKKMRRDMELVRNLLIEIANGRYTFHLESGHFSELIEEEKNQNIIVREHLYLMRQAELIEFTDMDFAEIISDVKLTWKGQDYLSAIESDTVWNKSKEIVKSKGLEVTKISFDTLWQIAIQQSKQLLGID